MRLARRAGVYSTTVRRSEAFETAAEKGARERRPPRRRVKHLPPSRFEGGKPPARRYGASTPPHVVVGVASPPFGRRGIGRRSSRTVNKTGLLVTAARRIKAERGGHRMRYVTLDVDSLPVEVEGHQEGSEYVQWPLPRPDRPRRIAQDARGAPPRPRGRPRTAVGAATARERRPLRGDRGLEPVFFTVRLLRHPIPRLPKGGLATPTTTWGGARSVPPAAFFPAPWTRGPP